MEPKTTNINKYLYFAKTATDYEREMYKFCLDTLKNGKYVYLITKHYTKELANAFKEEDELLLRCQLKRFIISKIPNIDQVQHKLMQQRKWIILPDLIVIDLFSYINDMRRISWKRKHLLCTNPKPPILHLAQCAAALGEYLNVMQRRKIHKANKKNDILRPVIPGVSRIPLKRQKRHDDHDMTPHQLFISLWQKNFQPCPKMKHNDEVMQIEKSTKLSIDVIVTFTTDADPLTHAQYNTLIYLYFYAYKRLRNFTALTPYIEKPIFSVSQSQNTNGQNNLSDDTSVLSDVTIEETESE